MRKRVLTAIILGVLLSVSSFGQDSSALLTFKDALVMMQNQNSALQAAKQEIEQKEYEKQARRGLYMPSVSLNAEAVTMSDPIHLDMTDVRDAITPLYDALGNYGVFSDVPYANPATGEMMSLDQQMSTPAVREQLLEGREAVANGDWDPVIQEKTFATLNAGVTWPIFTGGKIYGANKAAGVETKIAELDLQKVEGELLTELVTRYYGAVLAIQVSQVMEEKYKAMEKHYNDADLKFEQGMLAKVELLNAAVALSDAKRDYLSATRRVETVQAGLSATLASDSDTSFTPIDYLFVNNNVPELDYWLSQTMASSPILQQIDHKKELVDIKGTVAKGEYLPTVALMGTYNLAEYDLSPYVPNWMVGVGMKWTIFDGMTRNKQLKADKVMEHKVMSLKDNATDNFKAYVIKLYNDLNDYKLEIEELENTEALAEEYSQSTQKAFEEGLANSTDVVTAQSKLAQAKALRLKSFYSYDVTLSALLQVAGQPYSFLEYATAESTEVYGIE